MSRIAIFSDVHGNLPALKTILADLDVRKPDQVYCLGDLVDFAPWPNEVIELLRSSRIPCIMGNHDERIAFDYPVIPLKKHSEDETRARIHAHNPGCHRPPRKARPACAQHPHQGQHQVGHDHTPAVAAQIACQRGLGSGFGRAWQAGRHGAGRGQSDKASVILPAPGEDAGHQGTQ